MSYVTGPSSSSSHDHGGSGVPAAMREYFAAFVEIVRTHGLKGLLVLLIAALVAFAPLAMLYWFNELRLANVSANTNGQPVVVRSEQMEEEQEKDEPGETALLQVICETTSFGTTLPLLMDADPRRSHEGQREAWYIRREMVYVRPANVDPLVPFALLGRPPISVWLPAGDYEVLVVHDSPGGEERLDGRRDYFPHVTVKAECKLENKQKTVCRVHLPHYGFSQGFEPAGDRDAELTPLFAAWEKVLAIPTPGGYILALDEPVLQHEPEHRGCTIDFANLKSVPREWTREQLAAVRNWLPKDATGARTRLTSLVDSLWWREWLQGWYCYAAAGISGLVFTRWGALATLEPWRHGESFWDNLGLLVKIFFIALAAWIVLQFLTDGSGCSGGPVRFRLR